MSGLPPLKELCDKLVGHDSRSCEVDRWDRSNQAVVDQLANWLEGLGIPCEVLPVPGRPGKANLIATLGSGPGGLVLSGHTDTVPFDENRWQSDPFRLAERDGRWYGLGICDMKGFVAMAVEVMAEFREASLREPLILLATADEERGMDGARALVEAGRPRGRAALIGEPTGFRPVRLHKGIFMDSLRVVGRAGHSSRPDLGANAIEGMHQVQAALLAFRRELQTRTCGGSFALAYPTLNLGCIHGGDSANRIPAACELHLDLRFPPESDREALRLELRERAEAALTGTGFKVEFESLFDGVPAFETAADAEIVAASERLTGHAAGAVEFATEGEYLNRLGMETVILGPGDIEQAHQPDEFLSLDRIDPMRGVLRGLVRHFCVDGTDRSV